MQIWRIGIGLIGGVQPGGSVISREPEHLVLVRGWKVEWTQLAASASWPIENRLAHVRRLWSRSVSRLGDGDGEIGGGELQRGGRRRRGTVVVVVGGRYLIRRVA